MEVALENGGDYPQIARAIKRTKDNDGNEIGVDHQNPIMDTIMYEVQFSDSKTQALPENLTA